MSEQDGSDEPRKELLELWYENPIEFCSDVFRITLDDWQLDAIQSLTTHDRVAFIASKGVGKSFLEAMAAWWWAVTRRDSEVICTSTSADNLRDGLWKEIGKWYSQSTFLQAMFEYNSERVVHRKNKVNWYMSARSWRKHADPVEQAQVLAGIHGDHMLYLGDEAGDTPAAVLASAEAMLANADPEAGREAKLLLGGNPTDPNGPLYRISTKDRDLWHVVNINGDPDNPKRSPRVSIKWAREQIQQHGADNPWVIVSVFGRFPPTGFQNLLGPDEVLDAMNRGVDYNDYAFAQKRLGVDVATFGDDRSAIFARQGLKAGPFVELRNLDTQQLASRVLLGIERQAPEMVIVDVDGVGRGVADAMNAAGAPPIGVHGSGAPDDPRYYNKRAECWFRLRDWVKKGGALPKGDQLVKELTAPTYLLKNGKLLIEPKELIKKRLGFSPDLADALAYTFHSAEVPKASPVPIFPQAGGGSVSWDYDPLADKSERKHDRD